MQIDFTEILITDTQSDKGVNEEWFPTFSKRFDGPDVTHKPFIGVPDGLRGRNGGNGAPKIQQHRCSCTTVWVSHGRLILRSSVTHFRGIVQCDGTVTRSLRTGASRRPGISPGSCHAGARRSVELNQALIQGPCCCVGSRVAYQVKGFERDTDEGKPTNDVLPNTKVTWSINSNDELQVRALSSSAAALLLPIAVLARLLAFRPSPALRITCHVPPRPGSWQQAMLCMRSLQDQRADCAVRCCRCS